VPDVAPDVLPLSDDDLWWRPAEGSNSIGNLILHVAGNARQWIIAGVGGRTDDRDRDAEFAAHGGRSKAHLLEALTTCFLQIDSVLAALDASALDDARVIQGKQTTNFAAIYHVVEHVSMHTGQIIQLAKWRAPGTVQLYEASSTSFTPLWQPTPRPR
jgi:uncharacterized damage-inducible protein DinB